MQASLEMLDLGIAGLEKTYGSLNACRQLLGEITDLQQECARAKADAAAAQRELTKLQGELAIAQAALDKAQAERAVVEEKVHELRSVHSELSNDLARIKQMVAA